MQIVSTASVMELDELEIDPSMFESNTVESYFKISSRYKSELKAKIIEYLGEITTNSKKYIIS